MSDSLENIIAQHHVTSKNTCIRAAPYGGFYEKKLFQQTEERRLGGSMFHQNRVKLEKFVEDQRAFGDRTPRAYHTVLLDILYATIQSFQKILDEQAKNPIDNPDWNEVDAYLTPIFERIKPNKYNFLEDRDDRESEIYLLTAFILAHTFPGNQISVDGVVNIDYFYEELAKTIATLWNYDLDQKFGHLIQSYLNVLAIKKEANC